LPGHNFTHIVSIVGWDMDPENSAEYWVVRNSYGTFWGEEGFFRILFGNLRIDEQCSEIYPENK